MGHEVEGRATTVGPLSTASCGLGPGRSATVRCLRTPGDSCVKSVKAAWPVRTGCEDVSAAGGGGVEEAGEVRQDRAARVQVRAEFLKNRLMKPLRGRIDWRSDQVEEPQPEGNASSQGNRQLSDFIDDCAAAKFRALSAIGGGGFQRIDSSSLEFLAH